MLGDEFDKWFELEQVCSQCGQYFIADYKYNNLCWRCRHPELTKGKDEEINVSPEENEG
jgi:ribosomal protein S27AE